MSWPWSSSTSEKYDNKDRSARSWADVLDADDWSHYTDPRTIGLSLILTGTTLALYRVYKSRLRRIPNASHIKPQYYRQRSLFGYVTSVGDGDNFRLFHTPGGRLAGWGWLRKIPTEPRELANNTIHIRIAGIDAPELPHFGKEGQPFAQDALQWLRDYILHKRVRAYIYRRDQYDRVVATVFIRKGLFRRDVGLEMLKHGMADVYEAKWGMEFGKYEDVYRAARKEAEERAKGQWKFDGNPLLERSGIWSKFRWLWGSRGEKEAVRARETPREYKTRIKQEAQKTQTSKNTTAR